MTKVLKLEMKGFKSFGTHTEVPLGDTFNCVIGPNGSGKSNIIDAICFVLGKMSAKSMRAEKTANLIYNGGKKKNPAKQGEVSIYFDNSEREFDGNSDVLKVTRIIKQNGSSTYMMDNEKTTRTAILDRLAKAKINPDGYNIILQGDVVHFVEMAGTERREIVEQIAGIDIYEDKRSKAVRELDRVEEKLQEADLILKERKTRLEELREDRDKAQEFKDLKESLRRNKATLLEDQREKKQSAVDKTDEKIQKKNKEVDAVDQKIAEHRKTIDDHKAEIERINAEVEEKGEKEQVEIHKAIEKIRVEVALSEQKIDDLEESIAEKKEEKQELQETKEGFDAKTKTLLEAKENAKEELRSVEEQLSDVEEQLEEFKSEHGVGAASDIDGELSKIDDEIEEKQELINDLREKQQKLLREKDKKETKLEGIEEKLEKLREVEAEHKDDLERLKRLKKEFKEATVKLSTALTEDGNLSSQQSNIRSKLYQKKEELAKVQAKTAMIRERIGGGKAIQSILEKGMNGVHGMLSELGQVNQKYAQALEVAAGSRAKSIVTDTDRVAQKCIDYLKKNKLGIANFIPLNKIRAAPIKPSLRNIKDPGFIGLAIDLVDYDKKYDKAFRYALSNTAIVKDIESARRIGIGKVRMITLNGDKVEKSGAMQGGHRRKSRGLGFTQKQTKQKLEELEKVVADLQSTEERLSNKRKENEKQIDSLRSRKAELEGEIIKLEKSLRLEGDEADEPQKQKDNLEEQISDLEDKVFSVQSKISKANKELAQLKMRKQKLREKLSEVRSPEIVAEISSYEQQREELKEKQRAAQRKVDKVLLEEENVLGPRLKEIDDKIKSKKDAIEGIEERIEEIQEKVERQEEELQEKEASQEEFYSQFKSLFKKRNDLNKEVREEEDKIMGLNDKKQKHTHKINVLQMENAKQKAELQSIEEDLKEYEGVPPYEDKDIKKIKKEIKKCEDIMDNMGAVNMKSLEIYDTVRQKYESLLEKKQKLKEERKSVLVLINEVDTKKKELFLKTYEVVNHNFKQIFQTLSSKGKATLELENEEQPLDGGMNVKVKLSGNKYMDIRSLSGGEKTMTALAFIFAIQEHEPAAFYVLDEVDAALDKRNSDRLAKLVKEYSRRSQYLMISHNDNVIQEADNIYGISMNEHGVSKITTLEI